MPGQTSQTSRQRVGQRFVAYTAADGVVLPSVLMLLAILTVVSATSITASLMDLRISGYYSRNVIVFYIAEAGLNRGRHEVSDGDGDQDFNSILVPTTLFQGEALNGGSYTVLATPVSGTVPPRIRIQSTGCYPAADPCPRVHAASVVEALLESDVGAGEPADQVRLVAWKEVY